MFPTFPYLLFRRKLGVSLML